MKLLQRTIPGLFVVVSLLAVSACNRFGYDAHIESLVVDGAEVVVEGWVHDPYLTRWGGCGVVIVWVDGEPASSETGCDITRGTGDRPDVETGRGATGYNFSSSIQELSRGTHEICVDVVPADALQEGTADGPPIECRTIDLPFDLFDNSVIESASLADGVLSAEGWYSSVEYAGTELRPGWIIDGRVIDPVGRGVDATEVARPDVVASVGPSGKGYRLSTPVTPTLPNAHRVCLGMVSPTGIYVAAGACRIVGLP